MEVMWLVVYQLMLSQYRGTVVPRYFLGECWEVAWLGLRQLLGLQQV